MKPHLIQWTTAVSSLLILLFCIPTRAARQETDVGAAARIGKALDMQVSEYISLRDRLREVEPDVIADMLEDVKPGLLAGLCSSKFPGRVRDRSAFCTVSLF